MNTPKIKKLFKVVFIGFATYTIFILLFGLIFYFSRSLCKANTIVENYFDCIYFSLVTFATIGYGDITPANELGKFIVFFESVLSFVFISSFSGFFVFVLLRRSKDVFFSDKIYFSKVKNAVSLMVRFSNFGGQLINSNIKIEIYDRKNDMVLKGILTKDATLISGYRGFIFKLEKEFFETKPAKKFIESLLKLLNNKDGEYEIRVVFVGLDLYSTETIACLQSYKYTDIKLGGGFVANDFDSGNNHQTNTRQWKRFLTIFMKKGLGFMFKSSEKKKRWKQLITINELNSFDMDEVVIILNSLLKDGTMQIES